MDNERKFVNKNYSNVGIDTISKNFMRHLKRWHSLEKEVMEILTFLKNSKQRKEALAVLRNETNFDLYLRGEVCPNRRKPFNNPDTDIVYYPCVYCKGIFRKNYLRRHIKNCSAEKDNKSTQNCVAKSQTFTACHMDPANVVSKLSIKETVRLFFLNFFFIQNIVITDYLFFKYRFLI
ncbi:hypothetical protein NQ314_005743 [Rhamnusium bicolor]|uniref:Uncharacterized protein n=1 Tax=Rhamnusium bicolor TaxID=1586634 RepID=A0AAV8ZG96_9CUCU|nr:hypothetical protein NQ314_005743 [Rhamnusium bicolor]